MAVAKSLSTDAAVCNTIGCRRKTWDGRAGSKCCRTCAASNGMQHASRKSGSARCRDAVARRGMEKQGRTAAALVLLPKTRTTGPHASTRTSMAEMAETRWTWMDGNPVATYCAHTCTCVRAHTRSHASIPHAHLREHTGAYARMHEDKHARMHACTHACTHACRPVSDHAVSTPIQAAMPHSTRPGKCITAGCGRRT